MTRFKLFRVCILFWCFFIGVGALWGGIAMFIKPDGSLLHMQDMLPYFSVLPFSDVLFQNYIFSGIMLILVNGLTNILAAIRNVRDTCALAHYPSERLSPRLRGRLYEI